jgi:WD40 repeat protein
MRSSKTVVLFLLFLFSYTVGYSQFKNEEELKKQANKYFEEEDYSNGFKLYSQLVSTYPKDPKYNFRLGVCMLYTDPDKKKAISYLNVASKTAKENEKEALFYLGKAYHFNYRFDDAISYYVQYKNIASASMIKKLQVDREIQACKNGKRLLSNLDELVVLDKKQVNESDYYRSYDLKSIGGKLLIKPDEYRTAADKKKKDKSIIYLPKSNDQLYFAGYGEKGDNKDIYTVKKLPNGDWSKPENLGAPVNTEFDEDYPFLHPNGIVLYFASKGHNSMGGYDLFKSELDPSTNKWKEPVNLAFPINSPNDDILFVTDSLERIAFFSSDRQSPWGKTDVYKILTEKRPAEFAVISGTVLKKDVSQSVLSKIKVKNIETGEDAGTFTAKDDGTYSLKLPNGGKFIFTVETPDIHTQSEGVTIPTAYNYIPYKQAIGYDNQKLYITNFFDVKGDDENNYKEYLDLIAQKSKMDVNANDFGINPDNPLATSGNQVAKNNTQVSENNTQVKDNSNEAVANNNQITNDNNQVKENRNVSNKELIQMAYDDFNELQQAADGLKENATTAFSAANSKQDQANQKKQEAEQTQSKANVETDATKKQELVNEAAKQNDEVTLLTAQSATANNIAKQLEVDATNKQKEADLNLQYAKALEEAEKTKNNKQAIVKLEDLQKQLEEASKQKSNSNALVEGIKADANNKQRELQSAQAKQDKLDNDVKNITNEISNLDTQISATSDKNLSDNLKAQKQEQENDLADIKKEQETNKNKIASLKEEADVLKSQADFATTITGGNQEVQNNTQVASNNNQVTDNNKQTSDNTNQSTANNNQVTDNKQAPENNNQIATNNNQVTDTNTSGQNQNGETANNNQSSISQTNNTQPQIDSLNKQADDFSAQAHQLRKDAKTLTGTDKQDALNKIQELEKQATDVRYTAAKQQIDTDKDTYTNAQQSIQNLLKNPENKQNADRVQQLSEEADILNKAAQELKEESEADPSIDSRVGGLSNADEKQKAALAKQQEAFKLLKTDGTQNNNIANNIPLIDNTTNQQENKNSTDEKQIQNETNNENTVTSNSIEPANNEVKDKQQQIETTNTETVASNTIEPVSNEVQDKQQQNETNNTVASNTVEPTNNEQTANNLNPQPVNDIKKTSEYKQYNTLQQETTKYNDDATRQQNQADLYKNRVVENSKRAEQLKSDAVSLPDETEKYDKLQQAEKLEQNGIVLKAKADSLQELASNNRSSAETKKQETETYAQTLDKKTYDNIIAANSNKETTPPANEIKNNNVSNEVNRNEVVSNQNSSGNNNSIITTNNTENVNRTQGSTEAQKYIGTKGFEIKQGNAYTKARPIPLNEKLPEGLVFRVQIGAFKNPIATNQFKGLAPVGGETTPQGFIRYQAGLFDKYNNANAVKNDLKKLGYKDAFVVAYLNGKRVNLADALASLQQKGEPVNTDVNATAGITANNNVPVNNMQPTNVVGETQPLQSSNLTAVNGLLFTIQIGIYSNNVSNTLLRNLKPIYREKLDNGNYRYTAGIYSNLDLVKTDRRKVNAIGIGDAFVSAYLNGQRIKITDAIEKASNDKTIQFPPQQPIIFPGEAAQTSNNEQVPVNNNQPTNNTSGIQPFSNGVTEAPAATADNGVKANDDGITFKVQIGAFRNQVPQQIADTWLKVKTWPVKYMQVNDLYLYTVGSFTEARFAQKLRGDVVSLGITDAFIVVFKDGKKLYGAEAQKYLTR